MVYRVGVQHIAAFLQEVDIFRGLSDRHLLRIAGVSKESRFSTGDYLGIQNELGSELYVIRRGRVTVTTGSDDTKIVVRTVTERETVPVAVLFEPPLMVTTTRAATDGDAIVMPRVGLMELFDIEPAIGVHIYKAACSVVASRYRYALNRLADSIGAPVQLDPRWRGAEV